MFKLIDPVFLISKRARKMETTAKSPANGEKHFSKMTGEVRN
jgi:hypothetical protein